MALIICDDCKKEISDAAPACPHCGRPYVQPIQPTRSQDHVQQPVQRPQAAVTANAIEEPKKVGILLWIGIILFPLFFAWFTLKKGRSTSARLIAFGWLGFGFLLMAIPKMETARTDPNTPSRDVQTEAKSSNEYTQSVNVPIESLLSEYKENEIRADGLFKGKFVTTSGVVSDVKKDILNDLYVTVGTGKQFEIPALQAFFEKEHESALSRLKKGEQITVSCKISGLMMNVLGKNCVIK